MQTAPNSQPSSLDQIDQNGKQPQIVPLSYMAEMPDMDEEELDLGQLFAMIRRRALVILVVAAGVTGAVGYWTSQQTPQYEGKFQLLVEPVTGEGNSGLASRLGALAGSFGMGIPGGSGSGVDYQSQIALLKSPKLMEPIVQQLQQQLQQANIQGQVEEPEIEYKSLVSGEQPPLVIEQKKEASKIIEVRYQDPEPAKIEIVLKQLAESYLRYSFEDRQTNTRKGIQFIEEQLPQFRQRVDTLQGELQKFRQEYNLIDPKIQGEQLAGQITKIDDQLLEAQTALIEQQRLYEDLRRRVGLDPNVAIASSVLSEAPSYQQRLSKLKELESRIASELTRFTVNSPQIQAMLEQRQQLEQMVNQEAQEVVGREIVSVAREPQAQVYQNSIRVELIQQMIGAASRIEVLQMRNQVLAQAAGMLSEYREQFPIIIRQYTDLMRELQVASETLNQLLAQRESLRLEAAQSEIPWEIIALPEIPRDEDGEPIPFSPNLPRNLVLGAMLGLMLGFGAALLVERLEYVFHSPEDLKEATDKPLLGVIPISDSAKQLASSSWMADANGRERLQDDRDFGFLEAFRSLNTNLRFLSVDQPIRSIAIVSSIASEGKTTAAVNLAQAAATMDQRVLLVDGDLRRPQVHAKLGILNREGLSNVLATDLPAKDAIQRSPIEENLFILTAGSLPPDPIRLLSSKKMQKLMQQWLEEYDLVILDTPPLSNVVDARVLAGYTDGVALVVSIKQTNRNTIMQTITELKTSGIHVLGTIANGVKPRSLGWYDDAYRYSSQNYDRELMGEPTENTLRQ
jgi:succinoglycan biosynthesis transport protein ExoP